MAKSKLNTNIEVDIKVNIQLSLREAKALNGLVTYGHKPFLDMFYKNLGTLELKPHEDGLISLFETIRKDLRANIQIADNIIATISNLDK